MTAEFGGIIWLIFNVINKFSNPNNIFILVKIMMVILLGITGTLFVLSVINFIFCFLNYDFSYPKPNKAKDVIENNKKYLDEYSEKEVLDNVIQIITKSYQEMAINNMKETNERAKYLNKSYKEIVWVLGLMLINFVIELFI